MSNTLEKTNSAQSYEMNYSASLAASIREYIEDDKIQIELHRLAMGKKIVPLVDYFEKEKMTDKLIILNDFLCSVFSFGIFNPIKLNELSDWVEEETVKMRAILRAN